jgi:hypothetical protein
MEILDREPDRRIYWANHPDPEHAASEIRSHIHDFFETYRNSGLARRVKRSWRYYNGLFFGGFGASDSAIESLGDQGEYAGLGINEMRSQLSQISSMVVRHKPKFEVRAINTDAAAMSQARIYKGVFDAFIRSGGLEEKLRLMVEYALVFNVSYMLTCWNKYAGDIYSGNPETGELSYTGDLSWQALSIFDVAFDPTVRSFDQVQWVAIRTPTNKYDLAARYPSQADRLVNVEPRGEIDDGEFFSFQAQRHQRSELIDVWVFYHAKSEAMPHGRTCMVVDDFMLEGSDGPLPYDELPIDRFSAGEIPMCAFGYSPALDMQGPQEAFNAETSAIATNHKALGVANVWVQTGDEPTSVQLPGGLNIVQSATEPKPLELLRTPPEIFKFRDMLRTDGQLMSGVNDVRRGSPEGLLKGASGAAFALLDSKAVEANHHLMQRYRSVLEGIGTKTLSLFNKYHQHPRVFTALGFQGRPYSLELEREPFPLLDRIVVQEGNPLLDTTSGRLEIAQLLLNNGKVTTEEFLTFIQTGNYDPMLEHTTSQLNLIRLENEAILKGEIQKLKVVAIDNHVLHIQEHSTILAYPDVRNDASLTEAGLSHIMAHIQALQLAGFQVHQLILGYNLPLPATSAPGGASFSTPTPMPEGPGGNTPDNVAPSPNSPNLPQPAKAPQPQP